ncbi:embryo defective 2410 [Perilla frutescens var. hirtella]|uniref:Embryo defective 2410 n=1 Tax=Perilla frutescens var. hirtella TaxID=608512 RepID=A0AAD4JMP0_PERFH|nr:embryo defective 2410 [Perilla frutescens var. hirtella]
MSLELRSPFLGVPLKCTTFGARNKGDYAYLRGATRKPSKKGSYPLSCKCAKKVDWVFHGNKFMHFCGKNADLLWKKVELQSGRMINSVREPIVQNESLVKFMTPVWEEGLFLFRCSIFFTVISGLCLLVWYGRSKAKVYIEANLLPSVCTLLSDHLQRELDFGKVRRVSPLSITLESCSIGPHSEEFSCGEVPTIKLRIRPFASLRRGKIVIDAVLTSPSLLVAQKKNYTWLGIPYAEGIPQRHLSAEDGIDSRTRTRRFAREEAGVRWERERDDAAKVSAEKGYIISECNSVLPEDDSFKEHMALPTRTRLGTLDHFPYADEKLQWRDHHCMDAGAEYDLKHADLERSFGAKVSSLETSIWSSIMPGSLRYKFKRKANGRDLSTVDIASKRRLLERSASAACLFFEGQSRGKSGNCTSESICFDSHKMNNSSLRSSDDVGASDSAGTQFQGDERAVYQDPKVNYSIDDRKVEVAEDLLTNKETSDVDNKLKTDYISGAILKIPSRNQMDISRDPFLFILDRITKFTNSSDKFSPFRDVTGIRDTNNGDSNGKYLEGDNTIKTDARLIKEVKNAEGNILDTQGASANSNSSLTDIEPSNSLSCSEKYAPLSPQSGLSSAFKNFAEVWSFLLLNPWQSLKSEIGKGFERISTEIVDEIAEENTSGIDKMIPVVLDSVHFKGGTLMLLAYGDAEPREMEVSSGHVKFQNHYGRVHVQLSGNCKMWRSDLMSEDGGWLSTDVYVDIIEQKWHANLKIANLFVPLFERILDLPISWSKGRASGEVVLIEFGYCALLMVHICMSRGETFPNLHGQLDVTGLGFHIYDAPSSFSDVYASLFFRAQRIFLHNARGWFGDIPLEASGDFGVDPEQGEYHVMCQVPSVEVNALMKTFKMKPLLFPLDLKSGCYTELCFLHLVSISWCHFVEVGPCVLLNQYNESSPFLQLAGSVTSVFNCQGPLDAPVFVGSALVSRKIIHLSANTPQSAAYEAMMNNKEAGAVAAIDHVPLSYVSANFTFNTDNCVADLYGIRATLVDGGEIRGAGNAWICPEGEVDDTAMDINFSGNLCFDKIMHRYIPGYLQTMPLKLGDLNGETKVSGSLLKPLDIKWTAPKAEGSLSDARGDVIISHDHICVNSSSSAFELYTKVLTSYPDENWLYWRECNKVVATPFSVEGIELDLRMRNFEFFNLVSSYTFDSLRPIHLKATGKIKFQGKVNKNSCSQVFQPDTNSEHSDTNLAMTPKEGDEDEKSISGDISISGLKLNQLMLAPQLAGVFNITSKGMKLDATGRPDESLAVEIVGPLQSTSEENLAGKLLSFSLQKGHLKANACYRPLHSTTLEVRHLPLDELELASLRGAISRLNFQKRRGHGVLSVLRPKFSGVLGEALDVAARWSGDVITVERAILEQSNSKYELQGEYVLPGSRDRSPAGKEKGSLFQKVMTGHLGSMIASMGRWRMRLEVPNAEIAEMLPLARLLSRSSDPAVQSRSKDLFIQSLQSVGICAESLQKLLEEFRGHCAASYEVVLDDFDLPGLAELKGRWRGSLDASGGGNGDTMAEFDFHGEEWEWGTYETQRILAAGMYSNTDGLRLEKIFIQRDNATVHADGTLLGPKTNLHFAVLNFPVSLVPTFLQVIENTATEAVHSLRQLLAPIRGILHMEGDLKGNLAKPECDVQVRLLDGAVGGIELGRAEVVASLTPTTRFLFNAKFEPIVQNGHVHIQGSIPLTLVQSNMLEEESADRDRNEASWVRDWDTERSKTSGDEPNDRKGSRDKSQDVWDTQLAESLRGLNWNLLDAGEVRIDADIKDGGMMLLTALSPYANWLHGNAEVMLQVRGTVEQPVLDGSAYFHRATVSSPVLRKPVTNFGGTVLVNSNRLRIGALEGKVSRKGKLSLKGNLPLRTSEASLGDRLDLKCEVLEVLSRNILRYFLFHKEGLVLTPGFQQDILRVYLWFSFFFILPLLLKLKNLLYRSGQVDSQLQIAGSIMQPNISGKIKISQGEVYLPHDKGSGTAPLITDITNEPRLPAGSYGRMVASKYVSRFLNLIPASSNSLFRRTPAEHDEAEKEMVLVNSKPKLDIRLSDLRIALGPELRIVYPLILNFAVSGELELNGPAQPKWIKPKGVLTFENGDVNLVATQVRLKREHLNVAKFEPDNGLDPTLDLALVGSEWQFRIQSRASKWQEKLVVTSTRSVEQDLLSKTEAARVFESQLAESILEGDGQLAFKKLATATLETLMPRIEGKGEFGHARWRLVYSPQIPTLLSVDPTVDPLRSLASNISFGTEVEVQLGKRLQASVVRQMKDSEMAMQWTLIYQLTSRLRVLLQSAPSKRLLFEYSTTSQD